MKKDTIKSNIKNSEILGYALGDFGSCLVFGLVQSVLQKYYTDVLRIGAISILVMMLAARIWDAINDVICGRIIDKNLFHKQDKYRPWIKMFALPLAVTTCLMFVYIPGMSSGKYLAIASVTYILFGMIYTCVNIPYGTLAYSMGENEGDHTKLSIARSVGSVFGALPAMLLISFSYTVVNGRKTMNYNRIITGVCIIAAVSAVALYFTYRLTKERKSNVVKTNTFNGRSLWVLLKSRPYVSVCIAGMLFLAAQMFSEAYNTYLFDYYFHKTELTMLPTVCQYLPAAILIPFIGKISKKFENRQICAFGLLFAGICNLILFIFFKNNVASYIIFNFLSGFGTACMFLLLWALLNEAFSFNEKHFSFYDHATAYAGFLFLRKIGQSVEAILVNLSLNNIGYAENILDAKKISTGTLDMMFRDSVLIPAILFIVAAIILSSKWKEIE